MKHITTLLALLALTAGAQAQNVVAKDPWVRATVTQQKATGMFAQIISSSDARLVEAKSAVAGVVEIHEMKMEGNTMKMRAVPSVELPAGKAVELRPGGYHVMLMSLERQLQPGEMVPVTLVVEAGGKRENVEVKALVRPLEGGAPAAGGHGGMKH